MNGLDMHKSINLTIVLLTYNRSRDTYLQQAIEAILAQSYGDFELLVMDNHSEDSTAELVRSYEDHRITYIRQPPGGNATTNYLSGLWFSRGKYVLLTHDDDVLNNDMLQRQMEFIQENPKVLCVGTNVSLIDERGKVIQDRLYPVNDDRLFDEVEYIKAYLEEKLWLPTPTLLFDRLAHIMALSGIIRHRKSKYESSGDIWLLFLLNLKGQIGFIADPLFRYRQHSGQESRNVDQSAPMSHMARNLLNNRSRNKKLKPFLPDVWGSYIRFTMQDILFGAMEKGGRSNISQQLDKLFKRWSRAIPASKRAVDSALPAEIFSLVFEGKSMITKSAFESINETPSKAGAQLGYRNWLGALHHDVSIFASQPNLKKVALFGSMLTAFILVKEARKHNIQVVCCLDSAPARIGRKVLGVPILNLDELPAIEPTIDSIILTSERDHEAALIEILQQKIGNQDLPIQSWKDLAGLAMLEVADKGMIRNHNLTEDSKVFADYTNKAMLEVN